jgi:hypothetical protein
MFEITGRILTINVLSDKSAQVVLQKQIDGKKTAIAIEVYGIWKTKFEEKKFQKNDKIVGRVYLKSNLYKGKWYTDLNFREVRRWEKKPKFDFITKTYIKEEKKPEHELFFEVSNIGNKYLIDEKTGKPKF